MLIVGVPPVKYREMAGEATGETSDKIRGRVEAARAVQRDRFGKTNARMAPKEIKEYGRPDDDCQHLLKMAMMELNFSARAYDRVLKVPRTIADWNAAVQIQSSIFPRQFSIALSTGNYGCNACARGSTLLAAV
ncbi:MAG TPA: hypothetical protein VMV72_13670 [Verrucomicrobiae bacterium]|nr:hypothetical protein [Verrucomicrobiae bacterium]